MRPTSTAATGSGSATRTSARASSSSASGATGSSTSVPRRPALGVVQPAPQIAHRARQLLARALHAFGGKGCTAGVPVKAGSVEGLGSRQVLAERLREACLLGARLRRRAHVGESPCRLVARALGATRGLLVASAAALERDLDCAAVAALLGCRCRRAQELDGALDVA